MPVYMKVSSQGKDDFAINGGSKAPLRKNWIDLESLSFGTPMRRDLQKAQRRDGASEITEIVVTKKNDVASSRLFSAAMNSSTPYDVQIDLVKDDEKEPYLSLKLSNVLFSGYSVSSHSSGDKAPVESLTLNFTKISYEVLPSADTKPTGPKPVSVTYDLLTFTNQ